ncbi:MAG: hypothetical protein ABSE73_32425, partial [Planctomycetota bacterium]
PLPILLSDDMLILLLLSANHVNAMELHVSNSHFAPRSGLASGSAVNDQRPGRHWVRYRGSAALWAPR